MTATATYTRNSNGKNYWTVVYEDGTTFRMYCSRALLKKECADVGVTLL